MPDDVDLVRLLHEVDGQLGLAVYRGEGKSERWLKEAGDLITRIRSAVPRAEALAGRGPTVAVSRELLESLVDDSECRFDHHGGCQNHGYLSLDPGEKCPQYELKELLS